MWRRLAKWQLSCCNGTGVSADINMARIIRHRRGNGGGGGA